MTVNVTPSKEARKIMKRNTAWCLLAAALLLAVPLAAQAGLVIQEQEYDSQEPDIKTMSIQYLQKNRIKFMEVDDTIYYIWDLGSGVLSQVNTQAKVYTSGTLQDELDAVRDYMAKLEQEMSQEEAQESEEGEAAPATGSPAPKAAPSPAPAKAAPPAAPKGPPVIKNLKITKTDQTSTIQNFKAIKHEVRIGDRLIEEIWLSRDLDVGKELDYPAFRKMFENWINAFNDYSGDIPDEENYTRSEAYLGLAKEGYAMKRVEIYDDGSFISEVAKVERKEIPEAEFQIPKDFRKVGYDEFIRILEE